MLAACSYMYIYTPIVSRVHVDFVVAVHIMLTTNFLRLYDKYLHVNMVTKEIFL